KKVLLLTYNSKLKIETRERAKRMQLDNIEIHSYHSFCVKYFNNKCFTDTEIYRIIDRDTICVINYGFDIILLDECQDMTQLYYSLICKIIRNNKNPIKICVLGDKYQSIYDFNNSDSRYRSEERRVGKECR